MSGKFKKTERNGIRRLPQRGSYDKDAVYAILDANFLCHVGFVVDGQPFVIPTLYGRIGDDLYIHGSNVSRMLGHAASATRLCVTVTEVNALVLARSAFHHSANYRSAVVFGTGTTVSGDAAKLAGLKAVSDHVLKGRWEDCRLPNKKELNVTSVIRIAIEEASAKSRTGGPVDDAADLALPVWAGLVPIVTGYGIPVPDGELAEGLQVPGYVPGARA
jgi:hypothetical protein